MLVDFQAPPGVSGARKGLVTLVPGLAREAARGQLIRSKPRICSSGLRPRKLASAPSFQSKIRIFLGPAPGKSCAGRCRRLRKWGARATQPLNKVLRSWILWSALGALWVLTNSKRTVSKCGSEIPEQCRVSTWTCPSDAFQSFKLHCDCTYNALHPVWCLYEHPWSTDTVEPEGHHVKFSYQDLPEAEFPGVPPQVEEFHALHARSSPEPGQTCKILVETGRT